MTARIIGIHSYGCAVPQLIANDVIVNWNVNAFLTITINIDSAFRADCMFDMHYSFS